MYADEELEGQFDSLTQQVFGQATTRTNNRPTNPIVPQKPPLFTPSVPHAKFPTFEGKLNEDFHAWQKAVIKQLKFAQ